MQAPDVDEYLQDKLFGSKEPVSTTLLSFQLGQTLSEAVRCLQAFYESHKDDLDASYKVRARDESKLCIKIVDAKDLADFSTASSQIWMLSPQGTADKALIAAVAAKVQQLQIGLSIGRLRYLGLTANPLLEDGFSFTDAEGQLQHKRTDVSPDTAKARPQQKARSVPSPSLRPDEQTSSEKARPNQKKDAVPPKSKPEKQPTSTKKSPSPAPQFFTTASKTDALKSMRAQNHLNVPIREAVVGGDDHNDDNSESGEANDLDEPSREEQMNQLRQEMFQDGDSEAEIEMLDAPLGDESDRPGNIPEDVQSNTRGTHADEKDTEAEQDRSDVEMNKENTPDLAASNSPEGSPRSQQAQPTRRVRRSIVRKDAEGFDVHEEVWEDVALDSNDAGAAFVPQPGVSVEGKGSPSEESSVKQEQEPPLKRTAKAPPKMAAGKKQKTLMSFFGKK